MVAAVGVLVIVALSQTEAMAGLTIPLTIAPAIVVASLITGISISPAAIVLTRITVSVCRAILPTVAVVSIAPVPLVVTLTVCVAIAFIAITPLWSLIGVPLAIGAVRPALPHPIVESPIRILILAIEIPILTFGIPWILRAHLRADSEHGSSYESQGK